MLTPRQVQHGVSLVELMIGLTIFAILLSVAVPNFSIFLQNSKIRTAAEAIQNGLNLARAEAVRRNTNVQFVLGTGSSWTVQCATAIATDSDGDGAPDCPGTTPTVTTPSSIQTRSAAEGSANISVAASEVAAATGVEVLTPVFTTTLTFNGLGRVTTLPASSKAIFDITNPGGGTCVTASGKMRCLRVVATPGGQIRMCDPAFSSSDPQGCP